MEFLTDGLSSRQFTNLYEDAECEKERLESPIPDIPVLSYRVAMNLLAFLIAKTAEVSAVRKLCRLKEF